jgi:cystathionine gamma-synthase
MAAIAAVVEGQPADTVAVVPRQGYNVTGTIFAAQEKLGRMRVREVDVTDTDEVLAAVPGANLVWLESPTNPLLGIADLPVLIDAAHAAGAVVCMDSTFNTPMVLRPLDLGVDVVAHSATKYLAGHSDALMGALVARDAALHGALVARRDMTGAMPGALECFLTLRGVRTLALRMERAQANALELATRLAAHPAVARVRYPGLADDPWHERASRLHRGYGAMVSFEVTGSGADAERVCHRVELITHATSLGGVETLIERRARYAPDASRGTPDALLRMSVGIEHVDDLWADLSQALARSG